MGSRGSGGNGQQDGRRCRHWGQAGLKSGCQARHVSAEVAEVGVAGRAEEDRGCALALGEMAFLVNAVAAAPAHPIRKLRNVDCYCQCTIWINIKLRGSLSVTHDEVLILKCMLDTCPA